MEEKTHKLKMCFGVIETRKLMSHSDEGEPNTIESN